MIYGNYLRDKYRNTAVKLADAEGVPCVMEYSKGKNLRNYEIYGNSVQNGTPSPDTPIEIQSVGDYTTKNLLDYTTVSARSGMTVAFIDNGFVYTGNYYFDFDGSFLEIGSTYVMSWNFEGNDTLTPTWRLAYEDGTYSSTVQNGVRLKIAKSVSRILVYPEMSKTTYTTTFTNIQLELGSTATEYEPYHKYKVPITVRGKNLLPYPYIYTTKTIKGVTFTDNGDGSITIDGTATANAVFYLVGTQNNYTLDKCWLKIGDSYTISKILISGDSIANIYFMVNYYNANGSMKQGALATTQNTATSTIKSDFVMWGIYLLVAKDKTVNNTTIKLQIEKGTTATAYEPYKGSVIENIYLNEPLRKVGDYADYIDFKGQKVMRQIEVLDDTGTKSIDESLRVVSQPAEESITLPALKTFKGTSIMSVDTSIQPSNIKGKYIRT